MNNEQWHLDKKVPISILVGLFLQTMVFVWWASAYTAANDAMNARQNDDIRDLKLSTSALTEMKSDVAVIKASMGDIKAKLDKMK